MKLKLELYPEQVVIRWGKAHRPNLCWKENLDWLYCLIFYYKGRSMQIVMTLPVVCRNKKQNKWRLTVFVKFKCFEMHKLELYIFI